MTRHQKQEIIDNLVVKLQDNNVVYLADISGLNAADDNRLRRVCFEQGIDILCVKNSLLKKAMQSVEEKGFSEMEIALVGQTAVFLAQVGNAPARLIKEFRQDQQKPRVKAAYIEQAVFIGDEQLDKLCNLKSREELIGDIVAMLQLPMQNVVSALQSGGNTIAGVLETLSKK
jgi:large subunit ribosomal protein L10